MSQTYGKTSWKRFALVMVPSIAATAAIGVGLASSALAASFSVSGMKFKVTAADLDGTNFAQYGSVDQGSGAAHPVAVSAFDSATIQHLCQSVPIPVPGLGTYILKLHAGDDVSNPVKATNLMIGLDSLNADATFDNPGDTTTPGGKGGINIGQDAATLPGHAQGTSGMFGQAAPHAHLTNVQQTAWSTSAGTFKLPGLKLSVTKAGDPGDGGTECY
ncbi:DUF6230 family protein [Kitasatospora sp. MAP5-34]|uniref:DUF6230 family protein n=1 Tax=Kitasatospora sp. MAP5-34 TaxID=3035102 RepID=UPI002473FB69|nr:DUF6230 family protein [Kitasatospora sp. MAP5-34]MDH6575707.1 hypothetical protein [Kitasatospora sp. MAP5-34]